MDSSNSSARHKGLHPVTLSFADDHLEKSYQHYLAVGPRLHTRLALGLGLAFYGSLGLLDAIFIPDAARSTAWLIRSATMVFGMLVLLFTYHPFFRRIDQVAIAITGIVAAAGLAGVMNLMPVDAMAQYYVSIVIVVFWTSLFPSMRFIHGLWAVIGIVIVFFLVAGNGDDVTAAILAASAYFLVIASLLATAEAYARERRRRLLFERANQKITVVQGDGTHSLYDRLTGLASRALLADRLDHAIVLSRRDMRNCAGFFLDVIDFERANEKYGRDAGDDILQIIAQRLRQTMRESDTVARLGDSDFFVVARGIDSKEAATSVATRILSCIEQIIPLVGGESVRLNANLGVCLFPYPDCTADDIVYRAELALSSAPKGAKYSYIFYAAEQLSAQRPT